MRQLRADTDDAPDTSGSAGVMFYSHDTYGLGHLRRTLTLAHYLRAVRPLVSQLVVTGSPRAHRFQLPPGADDIKLASVVRVAPYARDEGFYFSAVRLVEYLADGSPLVKADVRSGLDLRAQGRGHRAAAAW